MCDCGLLGGRLTLFYAWWLAMLAAWSLVIRCAPRMELGVRQYVYLTYNQ